MDQVKIIYKSYAVKIPITCYICSITCFVCFSPMVCLKLNNKSHDENHSPFTFSLHHIQLNTTVPYSLDADLAIDIDKSFNYSIEKSIMHSINRFGETYILTGNNEQ